MAKEACVCGLTVSKNTGIPGCSTVADAEKRAIYVETIAADGTPNYIDLDTDTLDAAWWEGKLNETDPTKRFYPTPKSENLEDARADAIFQTANSQKNFFIQESPRTYVASFMRAPEAFLSILDRYRCEDMSKFPIDKEGKLVGYVDPNFPNRFYPLPLDKDTWYAKQVQAVEGSTVPSIMLAYEYDESLIDSQVRVIESQEIGINLLSKVDLRGLIDVELEESAVSTTEITFTATTIYGSAKNPVAFTGGVLADFTLDNTQTGVVNVPFLTLVESATTPGEYTGTYAAQTGGDSYQLTGSKTWYEFNLITGTF